MNRRNFIGAAGASVAVAAVSPVSPVEAEAQEEMKAINVSDKKARYVVVMKSERFEGLTQIEADEELKHIKDSIRRKWGIDAFVTFGVENIFKF